MQKFIYQKLERDFPCMVMFSFLDGFMAGALFAESYDNLVWNIQEQILIQHMEKL